MCALVLLASCAEMPSTPTAVVPTPTPAGYWNGDGVPGAPRIVVSISEQHAYFYKGKQIVGESTVSTGKPGFGTPPGHYTVVSKDKDHVSSVFGDYVDDFDNVVKSNIDSRKDSKPRGTHYDGARMPYAMFFRGGYAMHQGYVPPYAASHGCIRLPQGMAEPFFENAPVGTPVVVKQEAVKLPPTLPALNPLPAPSPPLLVRPTTPPASVRSTSVRSTVPVPTPVPVRSPAAVLSRAPARVRSPAPVPVPSPSPSPVRFPSPAPVRSPAPIPVRSPAPSSIRPTPTPSPTPSRRHRRVHSRAHVRSPAPSATPTPTR
jgi:L,D-transpeptidase catalytic domain